MRCVKHSMQKCALSNAKRQAFILQMENGFAVMFGSCTSFRGGWKNGFPIILHADYEPALLLRLSHERIAERSDLRIGAVGVLALGIVVMDKIMSLAPSPAPVY